MNALLLSLCKNQPNYIPGGWTWLLQILGSWSPVVIVLGVGVVVIVGGTGLGFPPYTDIGVLLRRIRLFLMSTWPLWVFMKYCL